LKKMGQAKLAQMGQFYVAVYNCSPPHLLQHPFSAQRPWTPHSAPCHHTLYRSSGGYAGVEGYRLLASATTGLAAATTGHADRLWSHGYTHRATWYLS